MHHRLASRRSNPTRWLKRYRRRFRSSLSANAGRRLSTLKGWMPFQPPTHRPSVADRASAADASGLNERQGGETHARALQPPQNDPSRIVVTRVFRSCPGSLAYVHACREQKSSALDLMEADETFGDHR